MADMYGSDYITIVDEDGEEFELEVLMTMEYNGATYQAVIPAVDADEEVDLEVSILKKVLEDGTLGVYETDRFIAPPGISLELNCDGSDADASVKAEDEEEYFFE